MSDGGRLSLRARRRLVRLRPPVTEPAARVWAAFDEEQRTELLRSAADLRHARVPVRAVVLAALQRQIEDRSRRWTALQLLAPVLLLTVATLLDPDVFGGWTVLVVVIPWAFGVLADPVQVTRARRANERLAREGGYPVTEEARGTTAGIDEPVLGDPLVPVAAVLAAVITPLHAADVHPVTAAVWAFPSTAVVVLVVLATGRGFVRGLREGRPRTTS